MQSCVAHSFREILATDVADGVEFDLNTLRVDQIREELEYGGLRLRTTASISDARLTVTIDVGFGDALEPDAVVIDYPSMLDLPTPRLWAYARETVIAKKFQAIVTLGRANSRMKDFYGPISLLAVDGRTRTTPETCCHSLQAHPGTPAIVTATM